MLRLLASRIAFWLLFARLGVPSTSTTSTARPWRSRRSPADVYASQSVQPAAAFPVDAASAPCRPRRDLHPLPFDTAEDFPRPDLSRHGRRAHAVGAARRPWQGPRQRQRFLWTSSTREGQDPRQGPRSRLHALQRHRRQPEERSAGAMAAYRAWTSCARRYSVRLFPQHPKLACVSDQHVPAAQHSFSLTCHSVSLLLNCRCISRRTTGRSRTLTAMPPPSLMTAAARGRGMTMPIAAQVLYSFKPLPVSPSFTLLAWESH